MRTLSAIVGLLILALSNMAEAGTFPLPSLPAGYEAWVHQENQCTLATKDGTRAEYVLNLYQQAISEKGTFDAVEIHRLNGEPYLVSHFSSRRIMRGWIPFEQKLFEVYRRTEQSFFVRTAKGDRWEKYQATPNDARTRTNVVSSVDRDYLSVYGTNTGAIKECLRAKSRLQGK